MGRRSINGETFAYGLRLADTTVAEGLCGVYYGDVLELIIEEENQAPTVDHLTSLFAEHGLVLLAPVQLTDGWDPRPLLLDCMTRQGRAFTLSYPQVPSRECKLLFFGAGPVSEFPNFAEPAELSTDAVRFRRFLEGTLCRSGSGTGGTLFVGGWGFSYGAETLNPEQSDLFLRVGCLFGDRHA